MPRINTFKLFLAILYTNVFLVVCISARYYEDHNYSDKDECICTLQYNPICGSDGKTYGNMCQLNCEKDARNPDLRRIRDGSCLEPQPRLAQQACICPKLHSPICGSDGKTYGNSCQLDCVKSNKPDLRQISDGPCENSQSKDNEPCTCPMIYLPVCGSDENTYWNICQLNCEVTKNSGLKYIKDGAC